MSKSRWKRVCLCVCVVEIVFQLPATACPVDITSHTNGF